MTLQLINRDPEPSESAIPVDTDIFLEIITTGDPIDNANTQVFVNGTLAYSNGVFQTGFNGPDSAFSFPFTDILQINIDPTTAFLGEQPVSVRVVSQTNPVTATIDETYVFTTADITAPQIALALAVDTRLVRVTFDEVMVSGDPTDPDDITNPANYTFASQPGENVPAVEVVAVEVSEVTSGLEVEIETDIDLSPGVPYLLTAGLVEDLSGNQMQAPFNTALFTAFVPPVPQGRRFDLWEGCVPKMNRREDVTNTLLRFIRCLQDIVTLLLYDTDRWTDILDPDVATEPFIDAMLEDLGNPFRFDLTLVDKRRLLRVLVDIYKQKGLAEGIENVVNFLFGIPIVVEPCTADGWEIGIHELGEDTILGPGIQALLFAFQITSPVVLTAVERDRIIKIATFMKPVNTHLKQIIEPTGAVVIDHWELGFSELGDTSLLH